MGLAGACSEYSLYLIYRCHLKKQAPLISAEEQEEEPWPGGLQILTLTIGVLGLQRLRAKDIVI